MKVYFSKKEFERIVAAMAAIPWLEGFDSEIIDKLRIVQRSMLEDDKVILRINHA